jgi:hypothetical protein
MDLRSIHYFQISGEKGLSRAARCSYKRATNKLPEMGNKHTQQTVRNKQTVTIPKNETTRTPALQREDHRSRDRRNDSGNAERTNEVDTLVVPEIDQRTNVDRPVLVGERPQRLDLRTS